MTDFNNMTKRGKKNDNNNPEYPRAQVAYYKGNYICVMGIPEGRKKGTKAMFEVTVTKNFSQINIKDQTTNPGSSENTKQDKYQTHTPKYSLNFRKLKLS